MRWFIQSCLVFFLLSGLELSGQTTERSKLSWVRDKPKIDSIAISGNSYFSDSKIKDRMYSRERNLWRSIRDDRRSWVQRETFGRDTLEIQYLYLSSGFLGVKVTETFEMLPDSAALVRVVIEEGRRFHFGAIEIVGENVPEVQVPLQRIAQRPHLGEPINLYDLQVAVFDMKTVLANNGYPYADVRFALDTTAADSSADVTYHLRPDSLVVFGEVVISGVSNYPERVARRELKVRPGGIYRRKDIEESRNRLLEFGYFSSATFRQADTIADRLHPDMVLRVRERKPMFITARTGVGQSEVRDLTWDISANVGKRNFLGSRRIDLLGEYQFGFGQNTRLLTHNYRLRYTEPWFLGIRMPLTLTGKWEPRLKDPVQDFRIESWSVALSTYKAFGTEVRLDVGAEYEEVNIFDIPKDQIELTEEIEDRLTVRRKLFTSLRRDSRDNRFIPHSGSLAEILVEYYGGFLGGEVHFYKWQASWASYQVAWPGWISATRLKAGQAQEFGKSAVVPVEDRFYLGGANSVRSFRENTLGPIFDDGSPRGASYIFLFNQEFRWKTIQLLQALPLIGRVFNKLPLWQSAFVDVGNGFVHLTEFRPDALAIGYGTGVQLVSPAGPIRIDYARRVKTKRFDFEERWHFTILYAF